MHRTINLRFVGTAALAALALISLAYVAMRQKVAHASTGALSMRSCADPAIGQAQASEQQQASLYVNCGGFLQ